MTEARVFWIPGPPIAFARAGRNPLTGKRYNPHRYQEWRDAAAWELRRQALEPFTGPLSLTVEVHPDGITLSVTPRPERQRPKDVRADLDNYVKAVADALTTAGIIGDDRQIETITGSFEDRPGAPNRTGWGRATAEGASRP